MKLVYVCYGSETPTPEWVTQLAKRDDHDYLILDPNTSIHDALANPLMQKALQTAPIVSAREAKLNLDAMLFEPISNAHLQRFTIDESAPVLDAIFKYLYCLIRSDVVLCDLNTPSMGVSQQVMYSWLLGIPTVGISYRYYHSPWALRCCSTIVMPRTTDDILAQISASYVNLEREAAAKPDSD